MTIKTKPIKEVLCNAPFLIFGLFIGIYGSGFLYPSSNTDSQFFMSVAFVLILNFLFIKCRRMRDINIAENELYIDNEKVEAKLLSSKRATWPFEVIDITSDKSFKITSSMYSKSDWQKLKKQC